MAFTLERYSAVYRPLWSQKHCTLKRARKITALCWILVVLECCPWFGLAAAPKIQPNQPPVFEVCHRALKQVPLAIQVFFSIDFAVFYITPLIVATAAYLRIGWAIRRTVKAGRKDSASLDYAFPWPTQPTPPPPLRATSGLRSILLVRGSPSPAMSTPRCELIKSTQSLGPAGSGAAIRGVNYKISPKSYQVSNKILIFICTAWQIKKSRMHPF